MCLIEAPTLIPFKAQRKDVDFVLPEGSRDGVGAFGGVRIVVGAAAATDMS